MDHFSNILQQFNHFQSTQIITIVGTPKDQTIHLGKMLTISKGNEFEGMLIDKEFTALVVNKIETANWQRPTIIEIEYEGAYRLFWDCLCTRLSALVLGGGHISQPVVELLHLIGYAVTVIDDRPEFANTLSFPNAEKVICENFGTALKDVESNDYSAIIIVTRGHRYDLECLRAVLNYPVPYLGMIGSKRRVKGIRDKLTEEGIAAENLSRLRAPIGLDLGAQTPAEIALSIVAEILASARNATCLPLSGKRRE
ncbi:MULTISPECIES: XdhC family protein [Pelosinus]|jgi:xanthine dehydrogenase accessory factor|uniref:Xanthine dehydrogenase accessory factor n=1 Tax=Pelosinus fermentans B4 TaxID=1149862 RepID=I9AXT3_9FIRM|nr:MULTISPECIES: XdhC family protein [Pelosinus]EIW17697.1 xanthine dehydrogenase accessory factor [Pelosinus fermentans B4]EIW23658.1 xanthine dehydrogenase accessory factor [Pelosinus fermentans A11]OAM94583.1 xanthine dehydrogenase accessory factor [Pelosinus fermentans DSM 17108]SDR12890.1 xanthine dehydrogenase accessory factor [Pelosinus fermentans]